MNDETWLEKIKAEVEEERRNYKGPHCCLTMDSGLLSDADVLTYNYKYGEYGIKIPKSKRYLLMTYCICCGRRFPPSLKLEWAKTLQQEYGLQDPMDQDKKRIPQEFLTDEWWKNRGINEDYFDYSIKSEKEHNKECNSEKYHHCAELNKELFDDESLLDYNLKYREYGIKIPKSTRVMLLDYCVFCGKILPLSVRDEWFDILEKEYELERPVTGDKKKVPKEFWTDEWWKKRGL